LSDEPYKNGIFRPPLWRYYHEAGKNKMQRMLMICTPHWISAGQYSTSKTEIHVGLVQKNGQKGRLKDLDVDEQILNKTLKNWMERK
jgi:hypothetical protein